MLETVIQSWYDIDLRKTKLRSRKSQYLHIYFISYKTILIILYRNTIMYKNVA